MCATNLAPGAESFIDPTASISEARNVTLGRQVYVGPFAVLDADEAPIVIGAESNVQDNVTIIGAVERRGEDRRGDENRKGPRNGSGGMRGVVIGERVILAHGATVKGPACIGCGGTSIAADPDDDPEVFLSFGTEVDGAVLEKNTGVSALGRVGPGVTLRSGMMVLPGKNVTTQVEADDPALGKVRLVTEADVAFNEGVIEVNLAFAREYTNLARTSPNSVRGASVDPGNTDFNEHSDQPSFAGIEMSAPRFPNRIIGDVNLADSAEQAASVMGRRISLRADEGEAFQVGTIAKMGSGVIFHALEHTDLTVGNGVTYGKGAIVHGGSRVVDGATVETTLGDNVVLGAQSVVFRSTVGNGVTIGRRSAVVASDLAAGTVVPDGEIWVGGVRFGFVEW
ncbi:MAG: acetyltransferase [Acidimicrobiales bacterium]